MGGRTAPCLLTVALSSVLILIISRQLPCVCRVAPRGSSAACMVTAILEVSVGKVCSWLVRLSWRGVLRFPADKERRGGRVKRFGSLESAWLPVSRLGGFPVARTSFDASRLHLARDILFLSSPRSAKVLSPKTPLLDEFLGKRLSWHPLAIYNPRLLLRETVSREGFQGGDFVVWAPHPLLLRLQTLGHPVAPYSPVSSRPLLRIAPKKCFHGNAECQSCLQVRSILYPDFAAFKYICEKNMSAL